MSYRRKNNLPIYITLAVILCLVVVIALIAFPDVKEKLFGKDSDTSTSTETGVDLNTAETDGENAEKTVAVTENGEIAIVETGNAGGIVTENEKDGEATSDKEPEESKNEKKNPPVTEYETSGDKQGDMSGVLFIGDSRTVGIRDYSDITEADYFATTGMSVFNIQNEKVDVGGRGAVSLDVLLKSVSYRKIFVMLGINELGYNLNAVFAKYKVLVNDIRELQPSAQIYVQANLHVVKQKSDESDIYNNPKIDKLNGMISTLADNKSVFYIDVNTLFDDENGNLSEKYAYDGSHLTGNYYKSWGKWLRER